MNKFFTYLSILFCCLISNSIKATHIIGGEIGYTNISGNTYEIFLTLYGDCAGSSYYTLFGLHPEIKIYDNNVQTSTLTLDSFNNAGFEVTPICAALADSTTCASPAGTIQGVGRFCFRGLITLSGPSANWRFLYSSNSAGGQPGRSNAITNIVSGSKIALEATLNNLNAPNNSSVFTTIPTPFFSINALQQYNQGAVDMDGDQLSFSLVPGYDGGNSSYVTYVAPYTYQLPLATTSGGFSFDNSSGQMNFTANQTQTSLVVNKVTEIRNGIVVGSTMREMNITILNNVNQSPNGYLATSSAGLFANQKTLVVCNSTSLLNFSLTGYDPDSQNITASVNGLPNNASSVIVNNGTKSPNIQITWNFQAPILPDTFTFYITYQDDGCPFNSKQTLAYSVVVIQPITINTTIDLVSCNPGNDGQINVNASSSNGALGYSLNYSNYQSNNVFNGLNVGNYTIIVKDAVGCTNSAFATVDAAVKPTITSINTTDISCYGSSDGSIQVNVSPSGTYTYQLVPSSVSNTTGLFTNIAQGNYTVYVQDTKSCADTNFTNIAEPPKFVIDEVKISDITCKKGNGKIIVRTNFNSDQLFTLRPGILTNSTGVFDNLEVGYYTITVSNINNCTTDTTVYIGLSPNILSITTSQQDLGCNGFGNEGSAQAILNGGVPPYTYLWNTNPPQTNSQATNLTYGWFTVNVLDATGCKVEDTVYINPGNCCESIFIPDAFTPNGDGVNDEWRLVTSAGLEMQQFVVYDRWGNKIWTTFEQHRSWDGMYQGSEANAGTYYYILRYKCLTDGKNYVRKGDFILVR